MTSAGLRFAVLGCLGLGFLSPLGACSSGSSGADGGGGGGGGADSFVGTWTYGAGSMITPMSCSVLGMTIPAISLAGDAVTITKMDATHIQANAGNMCLINFTVSGSVATAVSGQMCVINVQGINVTLNISSWTLTLAGGSLTSAESGSAPVGGTMCTATGNGTLTGGPTGAGG